MIAVLLVWAGAVYQAIALIAVIRFRKRKTIPDFTPPVSILKPVRGRDPAFYEAIRSHAEQWYPCFEIIFGVQSPDDPALDDIRKLQNEYPMIRIRSVLTANDAPNGKVGSLEILARESQNEFLLVNDGDISVERDYLARVISRLRDDDVGLATCIYRGRGGSAGARMEALGIATEFAPSVLVARMLSSGGFALGATMAFRRRDLEAIGGFVAIREYLADDYQLGARISAFTKRIELADCVVQTNLGRGSWAEVWRHQVRWSRTLRVSRPGGYFGYGITQTTFWCVIALLCGHGAAAVTGIMVRLLAATGSLVRLDSANLAWLLIVPFRDLFGFCVWCAGLAGNTIEWRGIRFRLFRDGRIVKIS